MLFPYHIEYEYHRLPLVTWGLIGFTTLVFLVLQLLSPEARFVMLYRFGFTPEDFTPISVVTATLLHAGWFHLIGNMYMLWLFGRPLEDRIGRGAMIGFYFVAGAIALGAHAALTPVLYRDVPAVGASGAIAGVLGASLAVFPALRVGCVVLLFEFRPVGMVRLHAAFVLGLWFFLQLVLQEALGGNPQATGVAYGAHLGGFLFGYVLFGALSVARSARRDWSALRWQLGLRKNAAKIVRDDSLPDTATDDPTLRQMIFLKAQGTEGDADEIAAWIHALDVDHRPAQCASLVMSSVSDDGLFDRLPLPAVVKGSRALIKLGYSAYACRLLLNRLRTVDPFEASGLLYELGTLFSTEGNNELAIRCLQNVVVLDGASPLGESAKFMLDDLRSA
jgi:membrane associated rhomboid family serine protease